MEVGTQAKLSFKGVDIINVNFNAIAPFREDVRIDVACNPKVFYPKEDNNTFKILMDVEVKDERYFLLNMRAIGHFELEGDIPTDMTKNFVNVNAPAIMFPYVRSFITTLTANLGNTTGTLVIPPQFFKGDLEELPIE